MKVASDILSEFLEVAFHAILYVRELYPHTVFDQKKKYGVPIQICVHPEVKSYISKLLLSLDSLLDSSQVDRVVFVVTDGFDKPIERFVFEILVLNNDPDRGVDYMRRLEETLRAFVLKLYTCDAELDPTPEECSWSVQVHTKMSAVVDMQHKEAIEDFKWIQADDPDTVIQNARLIPLKAMDSSVMKMELYAEESKRKTKQLSGAAHSEPMF